MDIKCGSEILEACEGATVPYTDSGFQLFVGEAVAAATGLINIGFQMLASELTENMIRGLNAIRCAITSGGYSVWYFVASAWWALYFFEQQALLENLLDEGYPYICTCLEDVNTIAGFLGANEDSASSFGQCSEAAENTHGAASQA